MSSGLRERPPTRRRSPADAREPAGSLHGGSRSGGVSPTADPARQVASPDHRVAWRHTCRCSRIGWRTNRELDYHEIIRDTQRRAGLIRYPRPHPVAPCTSPSPVSMGLGTPSVVRKNPHTIGSCIPHLSSGRVASMPGHHRMSCGA